MPKLLKNNLLPLYDNYINPSPDQDAAVLVAMSRTGQDVDLVLTQRSNHLNSHAGEVSLPGGKWEPGDHSPAATALRETEEEIALPQSHVHLLGELPQQFSLYGLRVTPVVGWVDDVPELIANPDELDSVFTVPLSFFLEDSRMRTDVYTVYGTTHWSPAWHYQGYEIWGLTARVVVNLLNLAFDANLTRHNNAPENVRR